MYALKAEYEEVYQEKIGGSFVTDSTTDIVALFDDENDAKEYIKKSKLKKKREQTYASDIVFKQNSLLSGATRAWVEEYFSVQYPFNPSPP